MSIKILNSRTSERFGNGLPIYKLLTDQIRFHAKRPYFDGLTICPSDRVPTFQFKTDVDLFECLRLLEDGTIFGVITIGSDLSMPSTSEIHKVRTSDGEFLYTSYDRSLGLSSTGIYHLGFRTVSDPVDEYTFYSEQFKAVGASLGSPCIINPPFA